MTSKDITTVENEAQHAIADSQKNTAFRDQSLIELGRLEAFDLLKKQTEAFTLKMILKHKEDKTYKGLPYTDENGQLSYTKTWEDYCIHKVGMSRRMVDENLANLKHFGEAFLESSKKIGLGIRDLKALRKLPNDEQTLVIESEAIDTGDKESIKDLIDDLKAKHKKELDAEKLKTKELDSQRQVAIRMRDEYQMKAMDYQTELESTKFKADAWKDQTKHLLFEATKYESNAIESLSRLMALRDHFLDNDDLSPQVVEHLAAGLLHSFKTLAEDFAQAWLETSSILEGYLPKMRPSLDVLQELNDSAMSNEE
ncbi:hypothetical protein [Pseudoalteromonas sp. Ps84H-4]|uniref:hypothetical protein n=1 Tax=Pseudoalteromonas sp. Ps84H-4 TaxID=2954502 RepID=UPI0020984DCD|nr:hypothetical protein [Pseudoalteromonas sp. Ps84H-4]MCO7251253.1 hypothetical protein [Pseudoalteromonas sp. Ps84H-4]